MENAYLIWIIIGIALILVEAITPGIFVFLFFGIAALLLGAITFFVPDMSITVQAIIFTISSLTSLLLFKRKLKEKFFSGEKERIDPLLEDFIGKSVVAKDDFDEKEGWVLLNGTDWRAKSENENIKRGEHLEVINKENLVLIVKSKTT